ncbi:hypothetical protein BHM03_00054240 [Ensete ventricosum]|nr:hypothetical protein BHM03_00054240 [Ensete ventricosum]
MAALQREEVDGANGTRTLSSGSSEGRGQQRGSTSVVVSSGAHGQQLWETTVADGRVAIGGDIDNQR